MTDKELLELAAKAAGIADGDIFYDMDNEKKWDPLTDDGDALRLAVKLDIDIAKSVETNAFLKDPYAATRRAIVRAAAEIGKAL